MDIAKLTEAEEAAMRWLYRHGTHVERGIRKEEITVRGGDLIGYYHDRWIAEQGERSYPLTAGHGKTHAWRRQGGTILGRINKKGYLTLVRYSHGVPEYRLTLAGKALLKQET